MRLLARKVFCQQKYQVRSTGYSVLLWWYICRHRGQSVTRQPKRTAIIQLPQDQSSWGHWPCCLASGFRRIERADHNSCKGGK
nr:MAG TPA: hypothetical protein [Caudoviricetes sp.]